MINVVICGAAGRMGKEIIEIGIESDNIKIVAGVEEPTHSLIGKAYAGVPIFGDLRQVLDKTDCIIDFTRPAATMNLIKIANEYNKPYVTGTTGFTDKELKDIEKIARQIPVFLAPNMSLGVNHLYNITKATTSVLIDYDVEIIETHHRAKKDAPSGTAKALARSVKDARPGVSFQYGRAGMTGTRSKNEVCINSVRGGDVVGEHRVLFLGKGEFLELRHYATSRSCFAAGTLKAVSFIIDKPVGLYCMNDLLTG